ncbi:hypothetical protein O181_046457 [Austropuccinia psidii MF-1]|uniref:Uncharacterized protein n=1 Tax=Austropuccinia psidii MF-1 TaxID=1389203 RepID=A0A9Q3HJP4_9BASI|nr:hypothetical protein [Austropuccinia psidii MF-1]
MSPYASPGSLVLSRIPTHHTQILMPVHDPDASHTKPCTVNPYARAAFPQCQQFLTPVQAPNASHENHYAWAGSQQFKQLLMPGQASNNSHTNPNTCTGSQSFTHTSLHLYMFPTIQTIPYAWAASRKF